MSGTAEHGTETRSLALTPTWSVASVLIIFIAVSLLVERSIHRLSNWLRKTNRKPLLEAVEKMKEELMLLGLNISSTHGDLEHYIQYLHPVKIHGWRTWEDEAHMDRHDSLTEITREMTLQRQSTFVKFHTSNPLVRNSFLIWVTCFFRQFGRSVVRVDYLALRKAFIMNHNLTSKYDFHSYMIRSMEEEFQKIVGVSDSVPHFGMCVSKRGSQWSTLGFVVAFILFNVKGSNLYFWIATIPVTLVLLVGAKLQHVIATLALESAGITGFFTTAKLKPRDDLFWFKKPELLLSLIHFILFQTAFELASFLWFWWQFGYDSCFIWNHLLVYLRLILGFAGQFLCSYSTLPLYALVTQMGTNYKAALIPQRVRDSIHEWGKEARRKRRLGIFTDDSTRHTDTSRVLSVQEDDHQLLESPRAAPTSATEIELQPPTPTILIKGGPSLVANEASSPVGAPLLRPSASLSSTGSSKHFEPEVLTRSSSVPVRRD